MGVATGPVPFTSYMTTPEFLRREPDVVLRFTRAVYRTQRWLATRRPRRSRAIGAHFPEVDLAMRERIVARLPAQDTWSRDPLLRRQGYGLSSADPPDGGFITGAIATSDLVDTEIARRVMAQDAG